MELRRFGAIWGAAAAAGLLVSGCATEAYVDEHIATVNGRIDTLGARVTANEGRIQELGGRIDAVDRTAQDARQRADAAAKLAQGKLIYSVISEDDTVTFATNRWNLSVEAQATLAAFADRLKSENRNVYVEIVGHGDPRGSVYNNRVLGEKRALEVRRFLSAQGIPLSHMETVSWGEERPLDPGRGEAANAANRRVVLRVLG